MGPVLPMGQRIVFFGFSQWWLCSCEEYYLLKYNAVQSVEGQPTFWKNISPQSSGASKPSKIPALKQVASQVPYSKDYTQVNIYSICKTYGEDSP
jgi:hypothetical protein